MKIKLKLMPINKNLLLLSKDLANLLIPTEDDSDLTKQNRAKILESDNDFASLTSYLRKLMVINNSSNLEKYTELFETKELSSVLKSITINVLPSRDTAIRFDLPEHVLLSLLKAKELNLSETVYSESVNSSTLNTIRLRLMVAFMTPYWFNNETNLFIKDNFVEEYWENQEEFSVELGSNNINDFIKFNFMIAIYNSFISMIQGIDGKIFSKSKLKFINEYSFINDYDFKNVYMALTKQKAFAAINLSSMEVSYAELIRTLIMESKLFIEEALEAVKIIKMNQLLYTIDQEKYLKNVESSNSFAKQFKKIKTYLNKEMDLFTLINEIHLLDIKITDLKLGEIKKDMLLANEIVNSFRILDINPDLVDKVMQFISKLSNTYVNKSFTGETEFLFEDEAQAVILHKPFSLFSVGMYKDNFQTMLSNVKSKVTPLLDMHKVVLPERKERAVTSKLYKAVANILYKSVYLRALNHDLLKVISIYEVLYDIIVTELSKNGFGSNAGQIPLYLLLASNPFITVDEDIKFQFGFDSNSGKFILYTTESEKLDAMQLRGFKFERTLKINGREKLNVHYYTFNNLMDSDIYNILVSADFPVKVNALKELFNLRTNKLSNLEDKEFTSNKSLFASSELAIKPGVKKRQDSLVRNINSQKYLADKDDYNFIKMKDIEKLMDKSAKGTDKIDATKMFKEILQLPNDDIIFPSINAIQLYKYLFVKNIISSLEILVVESNAEENSNNSESNLETIEIKFDLNTSLKEYNDIFETAEFLSNDNDTLKTDVIKFTVTKMFGIGLLFKIDEYITQYFMKHSRDLLQGQINLDKFTKIEDRKSYKSFITNKFLEKIAAEKGSISSLKDTDNKLLAIVFYIFIQYGADAFFDSNLYDLLREEITGEKLDETKLTEEFNLVKTIFTNKEDIVKLLIKVFKYMQLKNTTLDAVSNLLGIFILESSLIKAPNAVLSKRNEDKIIGAMLTNLLEFR